MALQLVDRLAEGDALLGVVVGEVGRALRDPDGLRGRAQARALERPQGDRQPLALLADQVRRRDAHVVEHRRAGRRALDAELVLELAHREALAIGLDDEGAHAPVLAVGHREHDVEVGDAGVRDPVLGAVDDPLVAVADGGRAHRGGVGAGLGLAQREGGRPLAGRAPRQQAVLELVGAEERDRQRAELLDHEDERARGARLGDLLDRDLEHDRAGARAAVLLVEGQGEDVLLGEELAHVPRVLAGGVDLGRARAHLVIDDLPDRVAEVLVLLREVVDVGQRRAHRTIVEPSRWV